MSRSLLPSLVQQFFTDRLCTQMNVSPNTIAGYRDTFRLLLRYASENRQATDKVDGGEHRRRTGCRLPLRH
jgi:hypothetical protein